MEHEKLPDAFKERLKAEIELFKVYAIFVAGLGTGISSILLREIQSKRSYFVLIFGIILLIVFIAMLIISFVKITKWIKFLNKE